MAVDAYELFRENLSNKYGYSVPESGSLVASLFDAIDELGLSRDDQHVVGTIVAAMSAAYEEGWHEGCDAGMMM